MRLILTTVALALTMATPALANDRYVGYVGGGADGGGAYHRGSQGGLYFLVFTDANFS